MGNENIFQMTNQVGIERLVSGKMAIINPFSTTGIHSDFLLSFFFFSLCNIAYVFMLAYVIAMSEVCILEAVLSL